MGVEEDGCNTVLVLGLGFEMKPNDQRQKPSFNLDHLFAPSTTSVGEPSLTLGFQDETYKEKMKIGRQSSPQSIVSTFSNASVKREKDLQSEGVELERASSRISDEDEEGSARKKLRLTKEQSALLEDSFKEHSTLTPKQKQALAKQLNLRPRQVEVWFQNRRARTKLKQTEVDCEFLKRCCETLTEENRRLHKELQELKALKYASPALYMQLPAATLAMCPSCERIGGLSSDNTSKNSFTTMAPKSSFLNPFTHSSAAC